MYVNFLSTYSDKKSCHTSITLQTSIARFVTHGLSAIAELLVSYLTLNSIMTLKSGLEITQDHSNRYHSKAWVRFPIRIFIVYRPDYGYILHHFRDKARYFSKIVIVIARQHTDARYSYSNSVCPSVRPSVRHTPVLDENGLTDCYSFFTTR